MEEDRGFEVVDKRRKVSDVKEEPAPEPEEKKEEPKAEPEEKAEAQEEQPTGEETPGAPPTDVYSLITFSIMMLSESAWQLMGLRVNPALGKLQKDMGQARIAIDSIVFLVDKIAPHISEEDRKAFRAMINDLQINFVQQVNKTE